MPIPPALIAAGASVIGDVLGNIGAGRRQSKADKANIKFWQMQNEYNDPAEQMKRLEQAGLNPNLVYGQSVSGATGQAGAVAPSKAAPYSMDLGGAAMNAMSAHQTQAQIENTNVNTLREMQKLGVDKQFLEPMARAELDKMSLGNMKQYLDNLNLAPFVQTAIERAALDLQQKQANYNGKLYLNDVGEFHSDLAKQGINPTGDVGSTLLRMATDKDKTLIDRMSEKTNRFLGEQEAKLRRNYPNFFKQ